MQSRMKVNAYKGIGNNKIRCIHYAKLLYINHNNYSVFKLQLNEFNLLVLLQNFAFFLKSTNNFISNAINLAVLNSCSFSTQTLVIALII